MGTNIYVSDAVWTALNSQKRPGESFDDVLRRVLELDGERDDEREHSGETADRRDGNHTAADELPADLQAALDEYRERLARDDPQRAEQRVAAARAVMLAMLDRDGIGKSAALESIRPEYPVDGQDVDTWWQRAAKDIFQDLDSVASAPPDYEYEYVGDATTE